MQLKEYVARLKKEFYAKEIEFDDICKYLSPADFYGKNPSIESVSEREICSQNFVTLVIKGHNISPKAHYPANGTTADLVFVEYDKNKNVTNACLVTNRTGGGEQHFLDLLYSYEKETN